MVKRLLSGEKLLLALIVAAIFLASVHSFADFDTGYHLMTGEYIATHGSVPLYDIFSYTAPGARWVTHYWLSDLIFYQWHAWWGSWGLASGIAALAAATYFLILTAARKRMGGIPFPLLFILPYSALTFELWVVRPQSFSYLCAALLIFLLEDLRRDNRKKWILWTIPFLFLVWANMHAGVVLGFAICGIYAAGKCVRDNFKIWPGMGLYLSVLISVAATLCNPNGIAVLTYSRRIAPVVQTVAEWAPVTQYLGSWHAKAFVLLMAACVLIVGLAGWRQKKEFLVRFEDYALTIVAVALPFVSIRHVGFFPLLTFIPFMAAINTLALALSRWKRIVPAAATLAIIFLAAAAVRIKTPAFDRDLLPVGAVDFIQKNDIKGPMFNIQSEGGYLIWRLWPEQKVFIDGRSEVYMGTPNRDFHAIATASAGWEQLVNEKYKINYFILWHKEPLYDIARSQFIALRRAGFRLVFWDDAAILLLRDAPQNKAIIDANEYKIIHPFLDPKAVPLPLRKTVVEETLRALEISPNSQALRAFAESFSGKK